MPTSNEIVVLLATYNGARYLEEQLDSILTQRGVTVRVVALDDVSTDETPHLLSEAAARDPRVTVLPTQGSSGSAAANFYRLIQSSTYGDDALVALSDQDDIWVPDKLARHSELLRSGGYDGVSSNVIAFDERGRETLVRKDQPQCEFDYLLQGPGPGSTFLMTGRLVNLTAELLRHPNRLAHRIDYQDWLIYAVCRARGWKWYIDPEPTVLYRQHENNVIGSNVGLRPAWDRLQLIRRHWHRRQAHTLALIAAEIAPDARRPELAEYARLFENSGLSERWALARRASQLRRRPRDQRLIRALIALGIW